MFNFIIVYFVGKRGFQRRTIFRYAQSKRSTT